MKNFSVRFAAFCLVFVSSGWLSQAIWAQDLRTSGVTKVVTTTADALDVNIIKGNITYDFGYYTKDPRTGRLTFTQTKEDALVAQPTDASTLVDVKVRQDASEKVVLVLDAACDDCAVVSVAPSKDGLPPADMTMSLISEADNVTLDFVKGASAYKVYTRNSPNEDWHIEKEGSVLDGTLENDIVFDFPGTNAIKVEVTAAKDESVSVRFK